MLAKLAVEAQKQEDRIEKRVQPNMNIDARRQIAIIAPPMPGGISGDEGKHLLSATENVTIDAEFDTSIPGKF